ncbi:MAG: hypothetical protein ACFB6S_18790 [Geminicoccaceae bacterium]
MTRQNRRGLGDRTPPSSPEPLAGEDPAVLQAVNHRSIFSQAYRQARASGLKPPTAARQHVRRPAQKDLGPDQAIQAETLQQAPPTVESGVDEAGREPDAASPAEPISWQLYDVMRASSPDWLAWPKGTETEPPADEPIAATAEGAVGRETDESARQDIEEPVAETAEMSSEPASEEPGSWLLDDEVIIEEVTPSSFQQERSRPADGGFTTYVEDQVTTLGQRRAAPDAESNGADNGQDAVEIAEIILPGQEDPNPDLSDAVARRWEAFADLDGETARDFRASQTTSSVNLVFEPLEPEPEPRKRSRPLVASVWLASLAAGAWFAFDLLDPRSEPPIPSFDRAIDDQVSRPADPAPSPLVQKRASEDPSSEPDPTQVFLDADASFETTASLDPPVSAGSGASELPIDAASQSVPDVPSPKADPIVAQEVPARPSLPEVPAISVAEFDLASLPLNDLDVPSFGVSAPDSSLFPSAAGDQEPMRTAGSDPTPVDLLDLDLPAIAVEPFDQASLPLEHLATEPVTVDAFDPDALPVDSLAVPAIDVEPFDLASLHLRDLDVPPLAVDGFDSASLPLATLDLPDVAVEMFDPSTLPVATLDLPEVAVETFDPDTLPLATLDVPDIAVETFNLAGLPVNGLEVPPVAVDADQAVLAALASSPQPDPVANQTDGDVFVEASPPRRIAPGRRITPEFDQEVGKNIGSPVLPVAEVRVVIHVSQTGSVQDLPVIVRGLIEAGYDRTELRRVPFTIGTTNIRYFFPSDRPEAELIDQVVSDALGASTPPGPEDFTHYRPLPSEGLVEIWVAS